jgi:mediator of RNA polymerase II transcription subunit 12
MTSRPTLGQRQPPQRSLSSTNVIQRPPAHRTLSQQLTSSPPTRRNNEGFVDLTFEGAEAAQGRYGTIPRMGGSRLRLEISDTSAMDLVESPKPAADLTPTWRPSIPPRGRPQLHFDVPNSSNLSPRAAPEGGQLETTIKPMPLPIRPGQHAPPTSEKVRVVQGTSAKKDARPKPYTLETPALAPRYPSNGM